MFLVPAAPNVHLPTCPPRGLADLGLVCFGSKLGAAAHAPHPQRFLISKQCDPFINLHCTVVTADVLACIDERHMESLLVVSTLKAVDPLSPSLSTCLPGPPLTA